MKRRIISFVMVFVLMICTLYTYANAKQIQFYAPYDPDYHFDKCPLCDNNSIYIVYDEYGHKYGCENCKVLLLPHGEFPYTHTAEAEQHYFIDNRLKCEKCDFEREYNAKNDSSFIYDDVPKTAWYKEAIDYVMMHQIMTGVSDTQMKPDANVTRAQFVKILANLDGADTSNNDKANQLFDDVPTGKWYTAAVNWAKTKQIVDGVGDNKFNPEGYITREQMCKMLIGYINYKCLPLEKTAAIPFADDDQISSWAREYVYECTNAGIIVGINGQFKPKNNATRAQIATVMMNTNKYYRIKG